MWCIPQRKTWGTKRLRIQTGVYHLQGKKRIFMHLFLSKNSINKFSFYCKAPYEADIGYYRKKIKRLSVYDWIKNLMTSLCQLGIYFSTSTKPVLHLPHQVKSVQWLICEPIATVQRTRIFWAVQTTKNAVCGYLWTVQWLVQNWFNLT